MSSRSGSGWTSPVWSHDGIFCTGESYKKVVKLTFAKGASLKDPAASLQLESRRKHTPRDRHPRRRGGRRVRLQGARSPSGRAQQFWKVETVEESEGLARASWWHDDQSVPQRFTAHEPTMTPQRFQTSVLALLLLAIVPVWTLAQRGGANSPFPGGENPTDPSSRAAAAAPVQSGLVHGVCAARAGLRAIPNSISYGRDSARLDRARERDARRQRRNRRRGVRPANREATAVHVRRAGRNARDSREAHHSRSAGRHRAGVDLQDVQGSAHLPGVPRGQPHSSAFRKATSRGSEV